VDEFNIGSNTGKTKNPLHIGELSVNKTTSKDLRLCETQNEPMQNIEGCGFKVIKKHPLFSKNFEQLRGYPETSPPSGGEVKNIAN
jgi:hypothetical protein